MSLRYALLALLMDGGATGYELAKRFDRSVANFWHALPQQLYAELTRMENDGLVEGEVVVQRTRPNKRIFSMTETGRDALTGWFDEPVRLRAAKDELLVRIYAGDLAGPQQIIDLLQEPLDYHRQKLATYGSLGKLILRGRSEDEFILSTRRFGPYVSLKNGIAYERSTIAWIEWTVEAMRARLGGTAAPRTHEASAMKAPRATDQRRTRAGRA